MRTFRSEGKSIRWYNDTGAAVASGDVVALAAIYGIAAVDIASLAWGILSDGGEHELAATTTDTWSPGATLYWNSSTKKLTSTMQAGRAIGVATKIKTNGQTTSTVLLNGGIPGDVAGSMWVSPNGDDSNDGSFLTPLATITAALAAVTSARKTIYVLPGNYVEAEEMTWPLISGVKLIGVAGEQWKTTIGVAAGEDRILTVAPGVQTSTFELWLSGMQFDHDEAGKDGIQLDNTGMTKKLNVYINDVGFEADSASDLSIDVTHGDTSNAVRIYWDGGNGDVQGVVDLNCADGGDRFYADRVNFYGGIMAGGNVTADIRLFNCGVLHEGITEGGTSTVVVCGFCHSLTGSTFAALDTDDVAGSITGETVFP